MQPVVDQDAQEAEPALKKQKRAHVEEQEAGDASTTSCNSGTDQQREVKRLRASLDAARRDRDSVRAELDAAQREMERLQHRMRSQLAYLAAVSTCFGAQRASLAAALHEVQQLQSQMAQRQQQPGSEDDEEEEEVEARGCCVM